MHFFVVFFKNMSVEMVLMVVFYSYTLHPFPILRVLNLHLTCFM